MEYPATFNPWHSNESRGKILFVGGIPLDCTTQELYGFLSKFDGVKWMKIEEDNITRQPKGYAFAILKTPEGYEKILNQRDHCIRGLKIGVTIWKDPKEYLNDKDKLMRRKVFVKRLHSSVTDADLISYFSQFGTLEKAEVRRSHQDNTSRRIGFVIFDKEDAATKCLNVRIHVMNGREIICKKCKNTTDVKKEKNGESQDNPFDSFHSMNYSNSSYSNRNDSFYSTSFNNPHALHNSSSLWDAENMESFYRPANFSTTLNSTAFKPINISLSNKAGPAKIDEELEDLENGQDVQILPKLLKDLSSSNNNGFYSSQTEPFDIMDFLPQASPPLLASKVMSGISSDPTDYGEVPLMDDAYQIHAPPSRNGMQVSFYYFPGLG